MRKILLGLAAITAAIVAPLTIAGSASADVPRCGGGASTTTTATFTVWAPAHQEDQWVWNWQHDFTITLDENGNFTGTGVQNGMADHNYGDGYGAVFQNKDITITSGHLSDDGKISYTATRVNPDRTWTVTNAQTALGLNPAGLTDAAVSGVSTGGDPVPWKISTPVLKTVTEGYKNHGQFVSESGGGVVAAQACTGMPL